MPKNQENPDLINDALRRRRHKGASTTLATLSLGKSIVLDFPFSCRVNFIALYRLNIDSSVNTEFNEWKGTFPQNKVLCLFGYL